MEKITLSVDVQTFNAIMMGLDELPHKISRPVIDDLAKQLQTQVPAEPPQGPLGDKVIQ